MEYSLCTLSGRAIVIPGTHAVHSAFSITPHAAAPVAPSLPPSVAPGVLPANPPVGLPQWPIDASVSSQLIVAAQNMQYAGYDLVYDLGLELDPTDVDMLLTTDAST